MVWDVWVRNDAGEWVIFETGLEDAEAAKVTTVLLLQHPFPEVTIKEADR